MKIVELTNSLLIALTNEESELLKRFSKTSIAKSKLSEREQLLANQLTVKDVLTRINDNGKIYYKRRG